MAKKAFRIMVTNYGYAVVAADNEAKALELVDTMDKSDFDWSDNFTSDDAEVVEELDDDMLPFAQGNDEDEDDESEDDE